MRLAALRGVCRVEAYDAVVLLLTDEDVVEDDDVEAPCELLVPVALFPVVRPPPPLRE